MIEGTLNERLEASLDVMSLEDMMSYVPESFLRTAVKGFLAGMYGPKAHKKNNWRTRPYTVADMLPSLKRHMIQLEKGLPDPDTGLQDVMPFIAARVAMLIEIIEKANKVKK